MCTLHRCLSAFFIYFNFLFFFNLYAYVLWYFTRFCPQTSQIHVISQRNAVSHIQSEKHSSEPIIWPKTVNIQVISICLSFIFVSALNSPLISEFMLIFTQYFRNQTSCDKEVSVRKDFASGLNKEVPFYLEQYIHNILS
jgi:hypothetical protein